MIQATNLTKHYGSKTAVEGLSFEVQAGKVTGFPGPNGAGKSTTIRLILGLDRPTSGQVLINGDSFARVRRPMCEVGALIDPGAVHGGRSVRSHLLCLAQSNGLPARRVAEVLDIVGAVEGRTAAMQRTVAGNAAATGNSGCAARRSRHPDLR